MPFIKKNLLKICMLLILLAAGIICVYAVSNYHGSANPGQGTAAFRNLPQGDGSQFPQVAGQAPRGRFREQNAARPMTPSGGRMGGDMTGGTAKYAPQLVAYAILFLILFVSACYISVHKKVKIDQGNAKILILTMLCAGLLLRISLATLMDGHPYDLNLFRNWATAAAHNLFGVYASSRGIDYPPLYMYILYLTGKIAGIAPLSPYINLLLKLPSMVADIATAYIVYRLAAKYLSMGMSVLLSAFYIFNPAVLINSAFWGQVDSFFALIVAAAVFLLAEKKTGPAAALFTAAVLMKPQGIIFTPVLFFELLRQRSLQGFGKAALFALCTAVIIVLPFSLHQGGLWIFKLFANTLAEYPYASVNAFNFFSLLGANYVKDISTLFLLSYHTWGMIFIVIITAFSWLVYVKGGSRAFIAAAALLQIAGVFIFSTRIHERYLFPAVVLSLLAFIYLKDKRLLLLACGFSATVYINTHYVLYWTGIGVNRMPYNAVLIVTSLLNVLLFGYLVKVLYDVAIKKKTYSFLTHK